MGIEIARIGAWLSGLAENYDLTLYSFHHYIYDKETIRVCPLSEVNHESVVLGDADEGMAFYCMPREDGPFRADVIEEAARRRGYRMILEEAEKDTNVYQASLKQISDYGLKEIGVRDFLKKGNAHKKLILNLFGGASLTKGFSKGVIAESVARAIAGSFPEVEFIIPCLPHQKNILTEEMIRGVSNLSLHYFNYNEENLTLLVSGSPRIITVEGGMLHLGIAYTKPVFCLIEKDWMQSVSSKLPLNHGVHYEFLDLSTPLIGHLLKSIGGWMGEAV
jgi:hypothetical protein